MPCVACTSRFIIRALRSPLFNGFWKSGYNNRLFCLSPPRKGSIAGITHRRPIEKDRAKILRDAFWSPIKVNVHSDNTGSCIRVLRAQGLWVTLAFIAFARVHPFRRVMINIQSSRFQHDPAKRSRDALRADEWSIGFTYTITFCLSDQSVQKASLLTWGAGPFSLPSPSYFHHLRRSSPSKRLTPTLVLHYLPRLDVSDTPRTSLAPNYGCQ